MLRLLLETIGHEVQVYENTSDFVFSLLCRNRFQLTSKIEYGVIYGLKDERGKQLQKIFQNSITFCSIYIPPPQQISYTSEILNLTSFVGT